MQKKMKLITTGGILGVFVVWNYIFEWLSKIGASIVSAVISEQLPAEAWNSQLYGAIAKQSLPFILMILLGAGLIYWSQAKDKALASENEAWASGAGERKEMQLGAAGAILAAVAVFALFLPTYMNFQDMVMAFSSPEGVDYILKMLVPNYTVLLAQLLVGLWMAFGVKGKAAPVDPVQEELEKEETDGLSELSECESEPSEEAEPTEENSQEPKPIEKSE